MVGICTSFGRHKLDFLLCKSLTVIFQRKSYFGTGFLLILASHVKTLYLQAKEILTFLNKSAKLD